MAARPKGFPSSEPVVGEDDSTGCSDNAVVGAAFDKDDAPTFPNVGKRLENFDVVDKRDAREPGRSGDGAVGKCWGNDPPCCVGEGSGGGGDGVLPGHCGTGSNWLSGAACARSRDKEEGRAVGEELARVLIGKSAELGGCVTRNDSSTSVSGGPGGSAGGLLETGSSFDSLSLNTFRDIRFLLWLG